MIMRLFSFIVMFCFATQTLFAAESFEDKIKKIEEQKNREEKIKLDNNFRKEMGDFLINNQNVSAKDFKKMRLIASTSVIVRDDLRERYGVTNDYQQKIKNDREKKVYEVADRLFKKYIDRAIFICKNDNESAALASKQRIDEIRSRISAIAKRGTKERHSDEVISLEEQILNECRYGDTALFLLTDYLIRGMREKFNSLMLKVIDDDQVNYDYLYDGLGVEGINTGFVLKYLDFLQIVNGKQYPLILSRNQVEKIGEALLTKHQEVFDWDNAPYYSTANDSYDPRMVFRGVQSLVNVSTWLREYKLDDLNDKFIGKFINNQMVIDSLREDSWFKDFLSYLQSRGVGTVSR